MLPDESLAPPLLDAGKRLLKFLQQRFGLFSPGVTGDGTDVPPPATMSESESRVGWIVLGTLTGQVVARTPYRHGGFAAFRMF